MINFASNLQQRPVSSSIWITIVVRESLQSNRRHHSVKGTHTKIPLRFRMHLAAPAVIRFA